MNPELHTASKQEHIHHSFIRSLCPLLTGHEENLLPMRSAFASPVVWCGGGGGGGFVGSSSKIKIAHHVQCAQQPRRARIQASTIPGGTESSTETANRARKTPILIRRLRSVLSRISPMGVAFFLMTYMWSFVLFVPMVIAHPFVCLFNRQGRFFHDLIAVSWMRLSLTCAAIKHYVHNSENLPDHGVPVVYVANHCSYIDIYAMSFLRRRVKFVSKAEIFKMPVVGWAMAMAGNVALRRASKRGQIEAYRNMLAVLKHGISLVVFPEGTRSPTGRLQRFHAGAFRAAKNAGVPVVPVTLDGTRQMMPADALLPLRFPWNGIHLTVHPPISSEDKSVEEIKELAFKSIDSALEPALQSRQRDQINSSSNSNQQ